MMDELPLRKTRAHVDLDALAANLSALQERSGGAGIILPVKADAYGHGMVPVARRAVAEGVAMLAVANAQEAAVLREAGIHHSTLILEDLFAEELPAAVRDEELRFNVSSGSYAELVSDAASAAGTTAKVHVNIDTGMGRMGLLSDDPAAEVASIAGLAGIEVEGVFSHFPDADEEDLSFARGQLERFRRLIRDIEASGVRPRYRHMANSAAVMVFGADAAFDLLRPGVSAYGMYPSTVVAEAMQTALPLRPCMTVKSALAKVTTYDRPWTVGYGRSYTVGPGSRIGVVPIGYGDGYRRALSNIGVAVVHGMRVPVCGRVSMDMITLDLTELPEEAAVGDEVVLLGRQSWPPTDGGAGGENDVREAEFRAEEMAELTGTISYEVTCGFTPRLPRVYGTG
jgi:alanine racemase